jgi:hypothetical protein
MGVTLARPFRGLSGETARHSTLVRDEIGELEQTRPHESSRADQVEQRILSEHGPALSLSTLLIKAATLQFVVALQLVLAQRRSLLLA